MPMELDDLRKLNDHELLAYIAFRLDNVIMLVQGIGVMMSQPDFDKLTLKTTLGSISGDVHLLRRKLVGATMGDPEER